MSEVTGGFWYKGARAAQHNNIFEPLKALFNTIRPAQVIELGTDRGGLSLIIRDLLDEVGLHESTVRTCDRNPDSIAIWNQDVGSKPIGARIECRQLDFWVEEKLHKDIVEYISRPGPTIVMCDGGNKPREFCAAARYIKVGDIIMAHDYAPDHAYFATYINNKIWNWHETWDAHLMGACQQYNLRPYMAEVFRDVVWACKQKGGL